MIQNLCYKSYLLLLTLVCICYNTALGQIDSLKFYQEQITELSQSQNFSENSFTYIDLINNLSYKLRFIELDSMEMLAKKALDLSKSNNYKKGELEALSNISAFHLYNGNTDKSIRYSLELINDKASVDYPKQEMKAHNQLGQAYFIKQNYPLTYTHFLHSLSLGEKHNDEFYTFRMNMNLGTMFNLLEDYDKGLLFYSTALKSSNKLNNASMNAILASNLGFLYVQKENFKKAEDYLNQSIEYEVI